MGGKEETAPSPAASSHHSSLDHIISSVSPITNVINALGQRRNNADSEDAKARLSYLQGRELQVRKLVLNQDRGD